MRLDSLFGLCLNGEGVLEAHRCDWSCVRVFTVEVRLAEDVCQFWLATNEAERQNHHLVYMFSGLGEFCFVSCI